ncbi:MAG TPA: amino acid adenylation domain-containing protein [Pyrinomonadaceae bacterium]|nr:amino acid adenylation domain-containing protein [Pyrinomonadaceae bacterium]
MKDISERISALTPEQRALFEARLKQKGLRTDVTAVQTIPRRQDRDSATCPASIDQERLWFIDQLQPGNTAYNIFNASRIRGSLNVPIMERVINELIQRHEVLRTTLKSVEGLPVQVIAPDLKITLEPVSLEHLPEPERYGEAVRLTTEEFARPFDLENGPLVRVGLLRLAPDDFVLQVNMHHAITDRWSFAVFEKELAVLYQAFATGHPSPLPELPIQFADYAVWQRERMKGDEYKKDLEYWRKQLAGAPFILDFPTDLPRPPIQNFRGARVYVSYPKSLLDGLKELSRREGVTMFMTLMAAFKTLIYRYTDQHDLLISTPIGTRLRPETENLVGYLLNLLIVRTDLSGDPTFRWLLKREQDACVGAFAHQEVPFGKLVQELKPVQDPSRNPIAQVAFLYLDFPEATAMQFLGLTATHIDIDNGASRFDITLAMTETPDGFTVSIEYIRDIFEHGRMERMAQHLQVLLAGIIANPDAHLSDLPILTLEERQQLQQWNDTAQQFSSTLLVHQRFEQQAALRPHAPALIFEDQALTFSEINNRANQLARHLLGCGLEPEARVGVMLPRTADTLAALLAIFKAGGCYLPLDPEYPAERRDFMLADAGASLLITEEFLNAEQFAQQSMENVETEVRPEQLAYLIYTSGSTGRPKGVAVEHRQLLHTMQSAQEVLKLTEADCLPSIASFSFDISLLELLCAPLAGGRCLLVSTHEALETNVTARVLREATVLHAVPGLMRRFLSVAREQPAGTSRQLRQLLVGGEAVAPELVAEMQEVWGSADVRVLYGPTEATIICASYEVSREGEINHQMIGRPLPNTVLQILDHKGKLVPVGVDGEICIGGAGLARGYWQSADLTAAKFVSATDGARIYRTGDRGRFLQDGNIEFTGRIDEQVKVRGFRIELGEIESVLTEHESVREAVVIALEDKGSEKRLAAYVATTQSAARNISDLRSHLKERLPDYMIPAAFVYLDALPLTSHGKIDRRALPAPDAERPALAEAFIAPRTPAEKSLASIWTKLLGINRIGVNDSYFELGGDSLLATQLASQVRSVFEVELPLVELFRHPTLAEMAASIEEAIIEQMEEISDEEAEQLLRNET